MFYITMWHIFLFKIDHRYQRGFNEEEGINATGVINIVSDPGSGFLPLHPRSGVEKIQIQDQGWTSRILFWECITFLG